MERGKNRTHSAPKEVARCSYAEVVPKPTPGYCSQKYERTSRIRNEDKKSGSYERFSAKEKFSSRELHKERGSGQVGVRDEFKRSATVKVGNKGGYTEYYTEERVRNVSFGNSNSYIYGSNNNQFNGYNYGSNNSYDSGGYGGTRVTGNAQGTTLSINSRKNSTRLTVNTQMTNAVLNKNVHKRELHDPLVRTEIRGGKKVVIISHEPQVRTEIRGGKKVQVLSSEPLVKTEIRGGNKVYIL